MISKIKITPFAVLFFQLSFGQVAKVSIDFTTQKFIGTETELNREKYFNFHGASDTWDFNKSEADYLFDKLGIKFGRAFNGPAPFRENKFKLPSLESIESVASQKYKQTKNGPLFDKYASRDEIMTDHPRDGFQMDIDPKAIAEYNVRYIKKAFPIIPKYYEVLNEPFVHTMDFVSSYEQNDEVILQMTNLFKANADKINEQIPEIMVGGEASAWPEFEHKNFEHWNKQMKLFMDIAGPSMKFFSTHLYDGRNVTGNSNYRSGSNAQAIMDLIETYSYVKWGVVKPHLISEYGYTANEVEGKPYSEEMDGKIIEAINKFLMQLLDKQDRLLKSVPFIVGKAPWFYENKSKNPNQNPYPWVISRKLSDGSYKFTHLSKFFELWKDVEGKRVFISSNNPDVQVHAFVKPGKAYIALNNLSTEAQEVALDFLNNSAARISNITLKRLYVNDSDIPSLIYYSNFAKTDKITLRKGETIIMECDINSVAFSSKITENNYYSKTYMQKIEPNKTLVFDIDNVLLKSSGKATIKMAIGRAHGLSKKPIVKINGVEQTVPDNWAGYDQASRDQFFGVIGIPIAINVLKSGANKVEITFPDAGGYVSSVVLNAETK
jgi:Porphyranase catalytic subdomain 1/beta porphyranase A C-terminal